MRLHRKRKKAAYNKKKRRTAVRLSVKTIDGRSLARNAKKPLTP
jgi:hypothetical protein